MKCPKCSRNSMVELIEIGVTDYPAVAKVRRDHCCFCGYNSPTTPFMSQGEAEPTQRLDDIEDEDDDPFAEDSRRFRIIEVAVAAAERVITSASNGSCEETDYLTSEVARRFLEKVAYSVNARLHRKELLERDEKESNRRA